MIRNGFKTLLWVAILAATIKTARLKAEDTITCDHPTNQVSCNYFGVAQLRFVPFVVGDEFAVAFLGEFGPKSCRVNGTAGAIYNCHQIKFGAEYLGQKLGYNFATGKVKRWVDQYAVGGRYQYIFDCRWMRSLYIDASSAYSRNQDLDTLECLAEINLFDYRRLAGARYFDAEVGFEMIPWECGLFALGIGYNRLAFDKEFDCNDSNFNSVCGSVAFRQQFSENLGLKLDAQFKRAYNFAQALVDWQCETNYGILSLGFFGGYVWGKTDLPSSTTYGIEVGFVFGPYRNNCPVVGTGCSFPCASTCNDLIAWVSTPGVYIPTVLVSADERVFAVSDCNAVRIANQIPNQSAFNPEQTVDISPYFTGDAPITYSIVSVAPILPFVPWTVTVDPQTGIVTAEANKPGSVQVIVEAANQCGSERQTFTFTYRPA